MEEILIMEPPALFSAINLPKTWEGRIAPPKRFKEITFSSAVRGRSKKLSSFEVVASFMFPPAALTKMSMVGKSLTTMSQHFLISSFSRTLMK